MSPLSHRVSISVIAAGLVLTTLAGPVSNIANAADARVVVASAASLPAGSHVVSQSLVTNFDVALRGRDPSGLDNFLHDLTNSSSPLYRHFLTPSQFATQFGASHTVVAAVRTYLESYGLHVRRLTKGGTLLEMSGRTSAISHAFATAVETVHLNSGTLSAQFARPATMPAVIAHDVRAIAGLSSVVATTSRLVTAPRQSRMSPRIAPSVPGTCASASGSGTPGALTVQQQAQLYGLASAWSAGKTGVGQTIALYELGQYNASDTAVFFKCYGLSPNVTVNNVDGGATGGFSNEATMDIEAAGALSPGASLQIYAGPNSSSGPVDLYAQIANDNTASIVSTSWGDCESDPTGSAAAEKVIFEQMAAQGQTVIAATGDNGSSDCTGIVSNAPAVDDPASQPFVTAVGGLTINSISPLSETVWNANGAAGGGGVSKLWSRPSWQVANGIPASARMRMVPDLSVMANPDTGFVNYFTGSSNSCQGWCSIGGTSIGAPLVSSMVAVAAQVCNISRLGFINPTLYALARSGKGFVDVTTGSNDLFGTGLYSAGVGYDMASGLGSPDTTFVNDLCPSPASSAHSSLVSHTKLSYINTPSTFTVALRDTSGNPIVNTPITVSAQGHAGRIFIDSDAASSRASSAASYSVTSDLNGLSSFTLTASEPTSVRFVLKINGVPLLTSSVVVHPTPLNQQKPDRPVVTRVRANRTSVVLSLAPHRAHTPFVEAWQVSVDDRRTWHSYPGNATVINVMNLHRATTYLIQLRATNGNGTSPNTAPIRVTTLH